jgi:hypothetical protein
MTKTDYLKEAFDHLERRCPRLGHMVSFSYCRKCEEKGFPCFKVLDCWWEYFDIVGYMRYHLSPEQFQSLNQRKPKPKITSILQLIREARERHEGEAE